MSAAEKAHGEPGGQGGHDEHDKLDNAHGSGGAHHAEEGEPWLLSYADMVTLLMCFFILFFQTDAGNIKLQDPKELMAKLEELQKLLGKEEQKDSNMAPSEALRQSSGGKGSLEAFEQQVKNISKQLQLILSIGNPQPGVVELTFLNTRFFRSGQSELTDEAELMLDGVAKKLKPYAVSAEIEVEGHTDSDPISSWKFPTNWELSSSRAATVVRLLQARGLNPKHMRASGLAHYRPIVPEAGLTGARLNENKELNRRIVVRIRNAALKGPPDGKPVPPDESAAPSKPESSP